MQTYVAINGSSSFTRRRITSGYTTNPEVTLSTDVSCEHHGGRILTQKDETSISREVELRKADATNSAVILRPVNMGAPHRQETHQRTLKPLRRVRVESILGEVLKVSPQRAQALRSHRVTLIGLRQSDRFLYTASDSPSHCSQSGPSQTAPQAP